MTDNYEKEFVNVFGKKFMGGPLGLGDPEDRTLRRLEEQIFITQTVRDRAHHVKCKDFIKKWGECMEENSGMLRNILTFYTCKSKVDEMNNCLKHYYADPEFREECTQMYLEKRANYRRTGIIEKDPYYKKPYYESEKKKGMLEFIKKQKEAELQQKQRDNEKKD